MHSIRLRLFLIIFGATTFIWLCAAGWIYFSTKYEVARVLDARLMESARMVSSLIGDQKLSPEQAAQQLTIQDQNTFATDVGQYSRQLSCQIWSLEGALVSRSESAPVTSLSSHSDGFENTVTNGERWRVYAVVNEALGVRVLVGDSMKIRETLIGDVMKGLALPFILILPLLAGLIWFCVGRGLEPLTRLARSLAQRSAQELHAIEKGAAPLEVLPVVDALNNLFDRVNKAREQERSFTAYAAHELKTPLAGLKTQAQIALRTDDGQIQKQALSHIADSADRTSRMVRQLIDLARVDSTALGLRSEKADLQLLLRECVSELSAKATAHNVAITVDFNLVSADERVSALDPDLMYLVLRNLMENAVQHSPQAGSVHCAVYLKDHELTIDISDEGVGIEKMDWDLVVQRFYRGSHTQTAGSGLGLSIVTMALEKLGGSLSFNKQSSGFTVRVTI